MCAKSVDKISFTQYIPSNKCEIQGYAVQPAVSSNNTINDIVSTRPVQDTFVSREKSNKKRRNIILGLLAITGLAGLFYFVGRRGHLGERIQEFLGGMKKPQETPSSRTTDVPDINSGKGPDVSAGGEKKDPDISLGGETSRAEEELPPVEESTVNPELNRDTESEIINTEEGLPLIERDTAKPETELTPIEEAPVKTEAELADIEETSTNAERELSDIEAEPSANIEETSTNAERELSDIEAEPSANIEETSTNAERELSDIEAEPSANIEEKLPDSEPVATGESEKVVSTVEEETAETFETAEQNVANVSSAEKAQENSEIELPNQKEPTVNNEPTTPSVIDKPEKEVISKGLSKSEMEAIDATLDHTIPKIPEELRRIDIPEPEDIRRQILDGSGISPSDDIRRYVESGRHETAPRSDGGITFDNQYSNRYVIDLPNGEKLAIYSDIMYSGWTPHPQPKGIAKYSINALRRLDKDGNEIMSIEYYSDHSVKHVNIGNKTFSYSYVMGMKNGPTGGTVRNSSSERYYYRGNNLRQIVIENEETRIIKDVYYNTKTGKLQAIVYSNMDNWSDRKKLEIFDGEKLVKEIYNSTEREEREAIGFYKDLELPAPTINESGVRIENYHNLTKEEMQRIDSLFDTSVPEITEEIAHHKLPDINLAKQEMVEGSDIDPENFVDYVDFSKCVKVPRKVKNITYDDFVYRYTIDLPNDEKIAIEVADFNKFKTFDGKPVIHSVRRLDKEGNEIFSIDYYSRSEIANINRGDVHYTFEHDGREMYGFQYQNGNNIYCYSVDGDLRSFSFIDPQNKTEKEISMDSGKGKISYILYKKFVGKYNVPQTVRHDFFDDGKLISIGYNGYV